MDDITLSLSLSRKKNLFQLTLSFNNVRKTNDKLVVWWVAINEMEEKWCYGVHYENETHGLNT